MKLFTRACGRPIVLKMLKGKRGMRALFIAGFAAWSFGASAAEWPAVSDYINTMSDCAIQRNASNCNYTKAVWPSEYEKAKRGDYQGQRNVAFCLSTGCDGAIRQNKILGCAWRFVILESGHLSADSTDTTNLKYYCGPENVDTAGRAAAEAQARRLIKMIVP